MTFKIKRCVCIIDGSERVRLLLLLLLFLCYVVKNLHCRFLPGPYFTPFRITRNVATFRAVTLKQRRHAVLALPDSFVTV
jgi:hypothetical protein